MKILHRLGNVSLVAILLIGFTHEQSQSAYGAAAKTADTMTTDAAAAERKTYLEHVAKKAAEFRALVKKFHVPLPPHKPGCFHLVKRSWQTVPCLSDAEIDKYPPPGFTNAIQSTPGEIYNLRNGRESLSTPEKSFVLASVAIQFENIFPGATETDVLAGPNPTTNPNAYSIQNNTNLFPCTNCSAGIPYGTVAGIPNSASASGDTAWVQFAYQSPPNRVCVWMIDVTVVQNTGNQPPYPGYGKVCVSTQTSSTLLSGEIAWGEVIGYVSCDPKYPSECSLAALSYTTTELGQWYVAQALDLVGLAGQWTQVGGTILGNGGGSQAVFTKANVLTDIYAFSCIETGSSSIEVLGTAETTLTGAQACTRPAPLTLTSFLNDIHGIANVQALTGESNNFRNGPADFHCQAYECELAYESFSPQQ